MENLKNTWTAEEGEAIMINIMNGDTVELAKAKVCQGIINNIGPSFSDATDEMKGEYRAAKRMLKRLGYKMEYGYLLQNKA